MPLKVELKPGEKIILGQAVITNGDQRARFTLDGSAPLLREKDIMTSSAADTPAKLVYLAVQMMYVQQDIDKHHQDYFKLVTDILSAAPSLSGEISAINNHILTGNLYKGLKDAKSLIEKEEGLLNNVRTIGSDGLSDDGQESDDTA